MNYTWGVWSIQFLNFARFPTTMNNVISMLTWIASENSNAQFNPLDTEYYLAPCSNYNTAGVKDYQSYLQGIEATYRTLTNGLYDKIIEDLQNSADPYITCEDIYNSDWGSKPTPDLVKQVIENYNMFYNRDFNWYTSENGGEEMLEGVAKNPQDQLMADLLLTWAIVNPQADRISDEDMPNVVQKAIENGASWIVREMFDNAESLMPHSIQKDLDR